MSVVVRVRAPDGTVIGQCSAGCYDAVPGTRCRCICAGENHGVGETVAIAQSHSLRQKFASAELHPQTNQTVFEELLK